MGIVDEAEILATVGDTGVDLVIEATDLVGPEQADAFTVVCDLLATVRERRSIPAVGILLVAGEIDDEAFALSLAQMGRQDREETIVVPLTADQAQAVSSSGAHLFQLVDEAVVLIQAEASPHLGSTISHASKLRKELDELIERHCA